jgi:hypothetical protein
MMELEWRVKALEDTRATQWAKYDALYAEVQRIKYMFLGGACVVLAVLDVPAIIRKIMRGL